MFQYDDDDDDDELEDQSEISNKLTQTMLFQILQRAIKRAEKIIINREGNKVDLEIRAPDPSFGFEI